MIKVRVTIGELTEYALPFAAKIEMAEVNNVPYMKIYVKGYGNISRVIVCVAQMKENNYSVCSVSDELFGNKIMPTGRISDPFITEKQMTNMMFANNDTKDAIEVHTVDKNKFRYYFYEILNSYEILRFHPKSFDIKISDMGFKSEKIKRVLSKSFKDNHYSQRSISELIDLFSREGSSFSLETLREREIGCVIAKLKDLGLEAIVEDDVMINLNFIYKRSDVYGRSTKSDGSSGLF